MTRFLDNNINRNNEPNVSNNNHEIEQQSHQQMLNEENSNRQHWFEDINARFIFYFNY